MSESLPLPLTIAQAVATRDAAIAAANVEFERLAHELQRRIPPELQAFAAAQGWIDPGPPAHPSLPRGWHLPGWLEHLARCGGTEVKVRRGELAECGFRSFADAQRQVERFTLAWSPYIAGVTSHTRDADKVCIWFYTDPSKKRA